MALHGRTTMREPEQGEREATVDGVTYRPGDTVLLRPGPGRNAQDHLVEGRNATIERIYVDYDGRVQLGRDRRRRARPGHHARHPALPVLPTRRGGDRMTHDFEKQILVAGVGNAWMQDDGFGSEVAQRLERRELPPGVTVMDFGSRRPRPRLRDHARLPRARADRRLAPGRGARHAVRDRARPRRLRAPDRGRRDDLPARHGPADGAAVRAPRSASFSGKVVVVACEPGPIEDLAVGLSPEVELAVEKALDVVMEQIAELQTDEAYSLVHELAISSAVLESVLRHAAGRRVSSVQAARRAPAPGRAGLARVLLGDRDPRRRLRGLACWSRR